MAALVQIAAGRIESLIALAMVAGPRTVERALQDTRDDRPEIAAPMEDARLNEIDRLMRQRSCGELVSNT